MENYRSLFQLPETGIEYDHLDKAGEFQNSLQPKVPLTKLNLLSPLLQPNSWMKLWAYTLLKMGYANLILIKVVL